MAESGMVELGPGCDGLSQIDPRDCVFDFGFRRNQRPVLEALVGALDRIGPGCAALYMPCDKGDRDCAEKLWGRSGCCC